MRSITVKELKRMLEDAPEDYEVYLGYVKGEYDDGKTVLSAISGFDIKDDRREVRLLY